MDCQICLRQLERFEPVYRMQFGPEINNGWRTSVCSRCLSAFVDSAATGRRGAQHALSRLEQEESEAFSRLQSALQGGDRFQIDACQTYWLKVAETLRRSDASIDLARRQAEVQVPLKTAENAVLYCAEWLRISIATFYRARPMRSWHSRTAANSGIIFGNGSKGCGSGGQKRRQNQFSDSGLGKATDQNGLERSGR
jgi:hypothetical protein